MSQYDHLKPRFVREWYLKLKQRMKALKAKREEMRAKEVAIDTMKTPNQTTPGKLGSKNFDDEEMN